MRSIAASRCLLPAIPCNADITGGQSPARITACPNLAIEYRLLHDCTGPASSEAFYPSFDGVIAQHCKLDIVVNNAGVARFEMADSLTQDTFHKQFNVNVLAYFLQGCARCLKHQGRVWPEICALRKQAGTWSLVMPTACIQA
ncbi:MULTISPECIES: SDR family NAD(P)-dependent oxidoreductase [Novosphingobium]|uniref:SDR family NAD(P)-dependent oxidoreductase n=1 Tax=Novosphingobium TaxID=165696 RepID=UPI00192E6A4E